MYITAKDLITYTRYEEVQSREESELTDILEYVAYRIDAFCGQTFMPETNATKKIHGNGMQILDLPQRLESLTSVKFNGINQDIEDFVVNNTTSTSQIYYKKDTFPEGFLNIEFVGDWGFQNIPPKVIMAAKILAEEYTLKRFELDIDNKLLELAPFESQTMGGFNYKLKKVIHDGDAMSTGNEEADLLLSEFKKPDREGLTQKKDGFFVAVI